MPHLNSLEQDLALQRLINSQNNDIIGKLRTRLREAENANGEDWKDYRRGLEVIKISAEAFNKAKVDKCWEEVQKFKEENASLKALGHQAQEEHNKRLQEEHDKRLQLTDENATLRAHGLRAQQGNNKRLQAKEQVAKELKAKLRASKAQEAKRRRAKKVEACQRRQLTGKAEQAVKEAAQWRECAKAYWDEGCRLNEAVFQLEDKIAEYQRAEARLTERVTDAEAKVKQLEQGGHGNLRPSSTEAEDKIAPLRKRIQTLQNASKKHQTRADAAEEQVKQSEQMVADQRSRAESAEQQLQQAQQQAQQQNQQWLDQLKQAQQAVREQTRRAETAEQQCQQAQQQISNLQQAVANQTSRADSAERQLQQAQQAITEQTSRAEAAEYQAQQAQQQVSNLEQRVVEQTSRADGAERQCQQAQQQAQHLEEQLQQYRQVHQRIEQLEQQVQQVQQQLQQSQQTVAEQTKRAEVAEGQVQQLQQAVAEQTQRAEKAEGRAEQLQQTIDNMNAVARQQQEDEEESIPEYPEREFEQDDSVKRLERELAEARALLSELSSDEMGYEVRDVLEQLVNANENLVNMELQITDNFTTRRDELQEIIDDAQIEERDFKHVMQRPVLLLQIKQAYWTVHRIQEVIDELDVGSVNTDKIMVILRSERIEQPASTPFNPGLKPPSNPTSRPSTAPKKPSPSGPPSFSAPYNPAHSLPGLPSVTPNDPAHPQSGPSSAPPYNPFRNNPPPNPTPFNPNAGSAPLGRFFPPGSVGPSRIPRVGMPPSDDEDDDEGDDDSSAPVPISQRPKAKPKSRKPKTT